MPSLKQKSTRYHLVPFTYATCYAGIWRDGRFLLEKLEKDPKSFDFESFCLCHVNTIDQLLKLKTKPQSSGSDCEFERRSDGTSERWLFDAKHKKVVVNLRSPRRLGPSVIIGSQKTQIYQRFAGSRQEVFILKIQNDENNAAQQDNGRRFHI